MFWAWFGCLSISTGLVDAGSRVVALCCDEDVGSFEIELLTNRSTAISASRRVSNFAIRLVLMTTPGGPKTVPDAEQSKRKKDPPWATFVTRRSGPIKAADQRSARLINPRENAAGA